MTYDDFPREATGISQPLPCVITIEASWQKWNALNQQPGQSSKKKGKQSKSDIHY